LFYYNGFFIFIFIHIFFFFFKCYQLYHHHLLIPTLTPFTLPPSPVLKYIALQPNYSFCPFSSTLSPGLHPLLLFSPNLSTNCPSLLHTHHLLTNLLSQLFTTQPPAIPDTSTLHYNNRNTPKHTQVPQNPAAPPVTHPTSHLSF
jgi:hypothetical protein